MRTLCVFCGSSPGGDPAFSEAAEALGRLLAHRRLGLVYGGGSVGLMGRLADAALAAGGNVVGVIPEGLADLELAHRGVSELLVVGSMHERKLTMYQRADAFLALPGGFGTLDEFCEVLTWNQLGYHSLPVGLLNVAGFFDRFLDFLDHAVAQGLVRPQHRALIHVERDPVALLDALARYEPPQEQASKWIERL